MAKVHANASDSAYRLVAFDTGSLMKAKRNLSIACNLKRSKSGIGCATFAVDVAVMRAILARSHNASSAQAKPHFIRAASSVAA